METKIKLSKRHLKEKDDLYNKYNNCVFSCDNYYQNKSYPDKVLIVINNIDFVFKLPIHYPFVPPELFIGNSKYLNMLRIKLPELKAKGIDCLCCKSLTCVNNWKPSKRIIDILDEFFNNKKLIKNIIYNRFLKGICIKHNIPLELEYYIGEFL